MSEVRVLIEHESGHKQELSGDTVICFTISKAGEVLAGRTKFVEAQASCIGREIPDPIYGDIIGHLVDSVTEKTRSDSVRAGFDLHKIAQILEEKSEEIRKSLTKQDLEAGAVRAFKKMLDAMSEN